MSRTREERDSELEEFINGASYVKAWNDDIETAPLEGMTAEELDTLVHTLAVRRMVEALRDPERCTPGLFQAALRFLKDNDIQGLPMPGSAQELLKQRMGGKLPFKLTGS